MSIKIGIFFGGRSREREISFAGGRTVYDNLDKSLFEAIPLFVDSWGNFILVDWQYIYKGSIRDFYPPASTDFSYSKYEFQIYAESLGQLTSTEMDNLISKIGRRILPSELSELIDFAFLALHGENGEDGSIQGLLQFLQIPYTASGILPSAIGMDKAFQRQIMKTGGFSVPPFEVIERNRWLSATKEQQEDIYRKIYNTIGSQVVVKPSNQGSSIGATILQKPGFEEFNQAILNSLFIKEITRTEWLQLGIEERKIYVRDISDIRSGIGFPLMISNLEHTCYHPDQLIVYLDNWAISENLPEKIRLESFDKEHEVVIEGFLTGKEFSCIVIKGMVNEPIALPPTEIRKGKELFDYRSKYLAGLSSKVTPIDLQDDQIRKIQNECERLFTFFKFNTYARIDGFFSNDGKVFLNDPNTTSGMLPSSFFFHQAAEIGLNPSQFLTYIIRISLSERLNKGLFVEKYQILANWLDQRLYDLKTKTDNKKRIGVILGGYSSERHISIESGRNVYEKLASSEKYKPIPVFLTGSDEHYDLYQIPINILLKDNADDIAEKIKHYQQHPITLEVIQKAAAIIDKFCFYKQEAPRKLTFQELSEQVDAIFIALHGRPGEDGSLQKHLEKFHIPYNGSSISTSEITIDKYTTNRLLHQYGCLVANQLLLNKSEWDENPEKVLSDVESQFKYPLIAKPNDDGCSSAVKKINGRKQMNAYLQTIFRNTEDQITPENQAILGLKLKEEFPAKNTCLIETLIEKGNADGFMEITGGLITHLDKNKQVVYEMFEPSETLAGDEVLTLEEKFLAGEGQNITPARFDIDFEKRNHFAEKVKEDLKKVAQILKIEGYSRTDAFVKMYKTGQHETYIIEVNSLPGMTPATCIFHQAALNGYTPFAFIDQILQYAEQKNKA